MKSLHADADHGRRFLLCCAAGCAWGILAFWVLYGFVPLDVTNDTWLMAGVAEWDIQQRYAGWMALRNSGWHFPFAVADTLAYPCPEGLNIAFMDAMPGVVIFFKLFSGLLPQTFQFEGIYGLLAMMLQGTAAMLLLTQCGLGWRSAFVGTGFFVFSPIMIERMFRHTTLASHYLILFSMYLYFKYRSTGKLPKAMFPIAVVSVGITPYFLPMAMVFALLLAVENVVFAKKSALRSAAWLIANGAAGIAAAFCIGSVGSGYSASRDGYGYYSMNLNALFNPSSVGNYTWSQILPARAQLHGQYDGFNYLGAGGIVLAAAALAAAVVYGLRNRETAGAFIRRNGFLLLAALGLTAFAVSHVICFDGYQFVHLPVPGVILGLCGIFRASARMFYPVYYLLLLAGLLAVSRLLCKGKIKDTGVSVVLLCVLALQIYDLSGAMTEIRREMAVKSSLDLRIPEELLHLEQYDEMFVSDNWGTRMELILAGKNGLVSNSLDCNTTAAFHDVTYEYTGKVMEQLQNGELDEHLVYSTRNSELFSAWQDTFAGRAAFYTWDLNNENVELWGDRTIYFMVPYI